MTRLVNQHKDDVTGAEEESQRFRDWDVVDREKQGVDSRDKVMHSERNDQLFVMKLMQAAKPG